MIKLKFEPGASSDYPVAVFVHGRAGNISIMSPFHKVLPPGWNKLSLEAPIPDLEEGGFSWWELGDDHLAFAMADEVYQTILNEIIRRDLLSASLIGLGFSQGAALLSLVAQRKGAQPSSDLESDRLKWAGFALLAGFVIPNETFLEGPGPAVLMLNGTQDTTVPIEKARQGAKYLEEHGFKVQFFEENVAHKVGIDGMKWLRLWLHALL